MRRIVYSVAMSLDGYIAGPNGEADWIVMDPDLGPAFEELYSRFDTMLLGRKTWQAMGGHGGGGGGPFKDWSILVCSRTLTTMPQKGVTLVSGDLKEEVTRLKQAPGKDIWLFGGGDLFRSLLDLGLVDAIGVGIIPVLLGGGIPLLPPAAARATLRLTEHKVYPKTGTVSLEYAVEPPRARKRGRTR
jgi:dihydrofolate reductase